MIARELLSLTESNKTVKIQFLRMTMEAVLTTQPVRLAISNLTPQLPTRAVDPMIVEILQIQAVVAASPLVDRSQLLQLRHRAALALRELVVLATRTVLGLTPVLQ